MKKITKTLFVVLLFGCSKLVSQSVNIVQTRFSVQTDKMFYAESKLLIPIPVSKQHILLGYDYTRISVAHDSMMKQRLNGNLFKVGVAFRSKNDRHKNLFLFLPRLNGEKAIRSVWQWGSVFLHTHGVSPSFKWKAGVYVNKELFSPFMVPMLGFEYHFNEKFNVKTILPLNFHLNYVLLKDRLTSGFSFVGRVSSYSSYFSSAVVNSYTEVLDNAITFYGDVKLFKNVFLRADAGIMLGRKVDSFYETEKLSGRISLVKFGERLGSHSTLNDGVSPYLSLSLFYRLKTDK